MAPNDSVLLTKRALLSSKIAPTKNGSQHKWHLTTSLLVFSSATNTLLIEEPVPTIGHWRVIRISLWSDKNPTLKSNDHESE